LKFNCNRRRIIIGAKEVDIDVNRGHNMDGHVLSSTSVDVDIDVDEIGFGDMGMEEGKGFLPEVDSRPQDSKLVHFIKRAPLLNFMYYGFFHQSDTDMDDVLSGASYAFNPHPNSITVGIPVTAAIP
jgi:hypothetical protein